MEAQKAVEDQNVDVKNEVSVEKKKQPEPSTTTEDDKPAGAEISDREESSISVQDKDIPNDAAKGGTDTEEAGYKSDQSASEEGSTDNVVDRQRSKGSSGYEESDDYEEGEGSDVSEGQRMGNEDEEKEYDEGVSDNESSDVVIEESQSENGTEGYEEDREDESRDDEEFREELDKEDPQSVPRKTGFWDHDDRFEEISVEESRPPKGDRQLWDITSERWQHDKYVEAEQGPRSLREIEESEKQFERRNRRRNDRKLGDFMRGGRGRRGGGSGGGGRGGGGRGGGGRNERGPEDEDEYQQKDRRGPSSHLRGSPRGRGDFRHRRTERTPKESEYIEWGGDEEAIDNTNETVEHFDDLQTERINEKSSKDSKKHADTDIRSNVQHEKETYKRQVEQSHTKSPESKQSAQKQDSTKVKHEHEISRSRMKEENRQTGQSNVKSQESKQSAPKKQESAEEHRGPRGRGKGMTSKKITSAKKSAVDFRKERKKSEEHGDEEVYEDAEENIREEPDAAQQKHAVKPKRYSTQRQKQATANEGAPNQTDESVIQDQQYFDANLQGNYQPQDIAFNPNMMILLQQLQQMQMQQQQQQQMQQQQSVQQQQPVQQQQQSMPTQVPGGQNQGPAVLTPLMQQYMQQQLMNMQALQQAYAQQQQQMQQQMQGLRMSQQPTMPSGEPQGPAPEGGMMMPRNAFPNVSQSMPHYNIIQQNQPGIYPQTGGTQYVEQMMSAPQPPSQQSGLYIPQVQQVSQQQGPDETVEQYAQRKARPAAIPIKPPPEVQ